MSEKDDLMGLAFMVGGHINDLKQKTTGGSSSIVGALEDPKEFVTKMAKQNLDNAIAEAKNDLLSRMGAQANPNSEIKPNTPVTPTGAVSGVNFDSDKVNSTLMHTNQLLEDIAISVHTILKCIRVEDDIADNADPVLLTEDDGK